MDDSLSYIIGIWSFTGDYIVYWILLMIRKTPRKGMSIYTLDRFGLSDSSEIAYFSVSGTCRDGQAHFTLLMQFCFTG